MDTGISITINARDIPDLAAQLLVLHQRFNGIASLMATPVPAGDVSPVHAFEQTPIENAIREKTEAESERIGRAIGTQKDAQSLEPPADKKATRTQGRKKGDAAAGPKDRFFDEEPGTLAKEVVAAPPPPPPQPVAPPVPTGEQPYFAEMGDNDAYIALRARAKLVVDNEGPDQLRAFWTAHWPTISPEHHSKGEGPKVALLENNRAAIERALQIFDKHLDNDPITGEPADADPALDLL